MSKLMSSRDKKFLDSVRGVARESTDLLAELAASPVSAGISPLVVQIISRLYGSIETLRGESNDFEAQFPEVAEDTRSSHAG